MKWFVIWPFNNQVMGQANTKEDVIELRDKIEKDIEDPNTNKYMSGNFHILSANLDIISEDDYKLTLVC